MSIQQENLKAIADKIRELAGTSDKLVPSSFVDEVQNACDIKEAKGRTEGHDAGYFEGHTAGKTEGHDEGFTEGYTTGHSEGKEEAYAERPRFATGTVERATSTSLSISLDFKPSIVRAFASNINAETSPVEELSTGDIITMSLSYDENNQYTTEQWVGFECNNYPSTQTMWFVTKTRTQARPNLYQDTDTGLWLCEFNSTNGEAPYNFNYGANVYTYFAYE